MDFTESDRLRFWAKVDKNGPAVIGDKCWVWTAFRRGGYGLFRMGRERTLSAHRVSYELEYGIDPGDLFVCHRCDNPGCVRPSHLFLGTPQDNVDDMYEKGRRQRQKPYEYVAFKSGKLTEEETREILEALKSPYWGQVNDLAEKYKVTHSTISHLKHSYTRVYLPR